MTSFRLRLTLVEWAIIVAMILVLILVVRAYRNCSARGGVLIEGSLGPTCVASGLPR